MTDQYRYTECGLDYINLVNGFKRHDTPYGRGVSIIDADQLHEAIALHVVGVSQALRGQEVRFLRSLLDVSQAGLGDILGVSRATVARWEAARDQAITGSADRALRLFYALKVSGHDIAEELLEVLSEIDELEHHLAVFEETEEGWAEVKEAA